MNNIKIWHIFILFLFSALLTSCSGSGGGMIDDLLGGNSAPILTAIPDQILAQETPLHIDINNIREGSPGNDNGMSYTCIFGLTNDDIDSGGTTCASLPNSIATFNAATGILDWTPHVGLLGDYKFKVSAQSSNGSAEVRFTIKVRLNFGGIDSFSQITGTSVQVNWTPNLAAQGYQLFMLNTGTGQFELHSTITGGGTAFYSATGLTPQTGYTFRLQALDILGNLDGNVISKSFTTTELTKFSMTPATATVVAGNTQTITVQAFNSDGSPQTVGGLSILPHIQGGTSSGTFSATTDNGNGTYTFDFTPTLVGTPAIIDITTNITFFLMNTSTITVTPGPADSANSSISISSGTVRSGNSITVTATLKDQFGNLISSGVTVSFDKSGGTSTGTFGAVTNFGNGIYKADYTGVLAGTAQTIKINANSTLLTPSTTIQVLPGTPVSATSTLAIASPTVASGSSVLVTATLKDLNGNLVPSGVVVTFNKSGGTSTGTFSAVVNAGNGSYTTNYTGIMAGTAQTISMAVDGITLLPTVTVSVVYGPASMSNSTLTTSNSTIISGNFATITATIRDANNNPLDSGVTITFSKTGGTSTGNFGVVNNQGNGIYNIRYTGDQAGTAQTMEVYVNGVNLGLSTTVSVTPGAPSAVTSTIQVSSPTVASNNSVNITISLKDANNNPIPSGVVVGVSKTGGTSTGTLSAITNNNDGTYSATYSGIVAGTAQTLGILVGGIALGPTTSITVLPDIPSDANSTLTVSSNSITAGTSSTITATIKDSNNNPISTGIVVGFTAVGGTSTGTISAITNQGNGVYTATYTGAQAGTAQTIQATIGGLPFGPSETIQVSVGLPNSSKSTLNVSPNILASGNIANITATIRDSENNPITNQYTITFDASGGSSTGSFGSFDNNGSGNFATTFTGLFAGSALTIRVLYDGIPIAGLTQSLQVVPGAISAPNSFFSAASAIVQSGTSTSLNINLKDLNNNGIPSGLTLTFSKSLGGSDGTISTIQNNGNGNYSATYTGTTQGAAQTISILENGIPTGLSTSITVTAGPPDHMLISGPISPVDSIDCNGPYTTTLKDAANNTTSSLTAFTMSLSSVPINSHIGALFSDASCTVPLSSLSFGVSVQSQSFYYKSYIPQSVDLTLTPSLGSISSNTINITNQPVLSWIGTAGFYTSTGTGSSMVANDSGGGLASARGLAYDSQYFYVANTTSKRIVKYEISTGNVIGWIGHIGSNENIGAYDNSSGCDGLAIGDLTPIWCTGGNSNSTGAATLITGPKYLAVDNNYLYVTDSHRILRFDKTTGAFEGWTGKIGNTTPTTGICNNNAYKNKGAPGWCDNSGSYTNGNLDGELDNPQGIAVQGGNLYVADYNNQRIQRFDALAGTGMGWVARVNASPQTTGGGFTQLATCSPIPSTNMRTPGWCLSGSSGTAKASARYNLPGAPSEVRAPDEGFYNPYDLTTDSSYIYVADYSNYRIVRIDISTGAFSGYMGLTLSRALAPENIPVPAPQSNRFTSDWTEYGVTSASASSNGLGAIRGIDTDGSFLYVADTYNRIARIGIDPLDPTNYFQIVWVGRVTASPVGGYVGCSSTAVGGVTPGWCIGGNANKVGNTKSSFYTPYKTGVIGSDLYVVDSDNYRVQVFDKNLGTFIRWIGDKALPTSSGWQKTLLPGSNFSRFGIDDYSMGNTSDYNGLSISSNFLFQTDHSYHRIKKFNKKDGTIVGYLGLINAFPPTGPEDCQGTVSGMTPTWCTGGGGTSYGAGIQQYYNPYSLASDGTFVYIASYNNHRIDRVQINDGTYRGWVGKVATIPTDGGPACTGANIGDPLTDWCIGGTAASGNTDGALNAPRALHYDSAGNALYALDNSRRLLKLNPTDGQALGIIGTLTAGTGCTITSEVPQGWCTTATGKAAGINNYGGINLASSLTTNSTYIFVADYSASRITRYLKSTGEPKGFIGRTTVTNVDVSATGGACQGIAGFPRPVPGWCWTNSPAQALATSASTLDGGFNLPKGIWANDTYVYISDSNNNRIVRIDANTGEFKGWKGLIADNTGLDQDCIDAGGTAGAITPIWCYGGASGPSSQLGGFNSPTGIYGDANYLYIIDSNNNRTESIPIN